MKQVAFVVFNKPNAYSGGRIHALWLAYAFAANGYEVDFYTNCIPVFVKDMPNKYINKIHFVINRFFLWKAKGHSYQHVVLVPHLATWKKEVTDRLLFYSFASKIKKSSRCPMWFLDFECPNWINETDSSLRSMSRYRNSNRILKNCDIVLSTTKTGMKYAQKYYSQFNEYLQFYQLYLAINTQATEEIDINKKENRAMFIARFGQKHKNNEAIIRVINSLPSGFILDVLGNRDAASVGLIERIGEISDSRDVKIEFHMNISDREKFDLYSKVKIFFFPSKFEGYGLPPLEAQYMGASVICSDLPVLKEVNPMGTFVNFDNEEQLKMAVSHLLEYPQDMYMLRNNVEAIASPETFFENLRKIIEKIA